MKEGTANEQIDYTNGVNASGSLDTRYASRDATGADHVRYEPPWMAGATPVLFDVARAVRGSDALNSAERSPHTPPESPNRRAGERLIPLLAVLQESLLLLKHDTTKSTPSTTNSR